MLPLYRSVVKSYSYCVNYEKTAGTNAYSTGRHQWELVILWRVTVEVLGVPSLGMAFESDGISWRVKLVLEESYQHYGGGSTVAYEEDDPGSEFNLVKRVYVRTCEVSSPRYRSGLNSVSKGTLLFVLNRSFSTSTYPGQTMARQRLINSLESLK